MDCVKLGRVSQAMRVGLLQHRGVPAQLMTCFQAALAHSFAHSPLANGATVLDSGLSQRSHKEDFVCADLRLDLHQYIRVGEEISIHIDERVVVCCTLVPTEDEMPTEQYQLLVGTRFDETKSMRQEAEAFQCIPHGEPFHWQCGHFWQASAPALAALMRRLPAQLLLPQRLQLSLIAVAAMVDFHS
jgi:hypothetical protein